LALLFPLYYSSSIIVSRALFLRQQ